MEHAALIQRAAACDTAGDHEAAIQWLIKAAQAGATEAWLQLGRRYLLGDRASLSPSHAIQLLEHAAQLGSAEAVHQLAVLHALGLHVPQDWHKALSLLVTSAELGWSDARQQLQLLGSTGARSENWAALALSVDLEVWQRPAQAELLSQNPRIGRIPSLLSAAVCTWLSSSAVGRLQRAMVYDAVSQTTVPHATRTNRATSFGFTDTSVLLALVQTRIAASMQVSLRQLEAAAVLHYSEGEQIRNHYDFIDPGAPRYAEQIARRGDRVVTFLTYLNDNYEGGETEFPELGLRHRGTQGEGLYFVNVDAEGKPALKTLHAGRPPLAGEKWVLTQFIRDRQVF